MKKYHCVVCGLIYDEAAGWPQDGIAAGTRWEDIPESWVCPDCGVAKLDFEMVEI
jgi:rubredoxin-NAD+ reductase